MAGLFLLFAVVGTAVITLAWWVGGRRKPGQVAAVPPASLPVAEPVVPAPARVATVAPGRGAAVRRKPAGPSAIRGVKLEDPLVASIRRSRTRATGAPDRARPPSDGDHPPG